MLDTGDNIPHGATSHSQENTRVVELALSASLSFPSSLDGRIGMEADESFRPHYTPGCARLLIAEVAELDRGTWNDGISPRDWMGESSSDKRSQ